MVLVSAMCVELRLQLGRIVRENHFEPETTGNGRLCACKMVREICPEQFQKSGQAWKNGKRSMVCLA